MAAAARPSPLLPIEAVPIRAHPRRALRGCLVTTVALAALAAGCTDPSQPVRPGSDAASEDVAPPPTDERPGDDDADGNSDGEGDALATCDDELRATFVTSVDGQLDAIVERDWDGALDFASPGFRSGIDADGFRDIILEGFPVVAEVADRSIGECTVADREGTMLVTVEDGSGGRQLLLYLFERDDERWGISGAVPAEDAGRDDDTITT